MTTSDPVSRAIKIIRKKATTFFKSGVIKLRHSTNLSFTMSIFFKLLVVYLKSRDTAVDIVTGYRLDGRGSKFESRWGKDFHLQVAEIKDGIIECSVNHQ
jgi:hypothetical protein